MTTVICTGWRWGGSLCYCRGLRGCRGEDLTTTTLQHQGRPHWDVPPGGPVRHHRPIGQQAAVTAFPDLPCQPDSLGPGRVVFTHPGGAAPGVGHRGAQRMESFWDRIFIYIFLFHNIFTVVVVAAVAVGELQLDDGVPHARPEPADLSLDGEAVVLQLGGGDDGVGRVDGPVTGLTALRWHASHPTHLQTIRQYDLTTVNNLTKNLLNLNLNLSLSLTFVSEL